MYLYRKSQKPITFFKIALAILIPLYFHCFTRFENLFLFVYKLQNEFVSSPPPPQLGGGNPSGILLGFHWIYRSSQRKLTFLQSPPICEYHTPFNLLKWFLIQQCFEGSVKVLYIFRFILESFLCYFKWPLIFFVFYLFCCQYIETLNDFCILTLYSTILLNSHILIPCRFSEFL